MATRIVEGKKPYTGGKAISIDEDKVISLNLRDENNLIIYDEGDDEIYVDLQLPDGITPTDAFPVGVTTGRAVVADGWDLAGTIICAKTTSGDNIKLLYADDGTLWIDNGTGTFKQIYFKADVDALLLALRNYIDGELAKKQNGVTAATAPSNPSEGDLWYDTTNSAMKVWDGTAWQSVGTGGGSDIEYVTQVEYDALPSSKLTDGKHYVIYTADSPTPPSPGWQPGVNTLFYFPLKSDILDYSGNNISASGGGTITYQGGAGALITSVITIDYNIQPTDFTASCFMKNVTTSDVIIAFSNLQSGGGFKGWDIATNVYNAGQPNSVRIECLGDSPTRKQSFTPTGGDTTTRHLVTFVKDGTNSMGYFYINGSLVGSQSLVGTASTGNYFLCDGSSMYFGDVILEDRIWTAQEIADYYNQTKANYGIS